MAGVLNDELLNNSSSPVSVAAGEKVEWLVEYTVQPEDYVPDTLCELVNVVTVNATYGSSDFDLQAEVCVDIIEKEAPCIDVIKSVNVTSALVGDWVQFNVTVVNCGDVDLSIGVWDGLLGIDEYINVAAGQKHQYLVDYQIPAASYNPGAPCDIFNVATINATHGDWNGSDVDDVCINVENPCLQLFKTVTSTGPYYVGDTVTYNVTLVNCGDVDLDAVLNDVLLGNVSVPVGIDAGKTITWVVDYVIKDTDLSPLCNVVTVNATYSSADFDLQAQACIDILEVEQPCFYVLKSVNDTTVMRGDWVKFNVTVVNCGDVDLDLNITDVLGIPEQVIHVLAGEKWEYTYDYQVPSDGYALGAACDIENTVYANSTHNGWFDEDSASVCLDVVTPCIDIDKTANATSALIGDTVRYYYNVTNCGDVTLNVTVTDDILGPIGTIENLAPGTWQELSADMLVTGSGTIDPLVLPETAAVSATYQSAGAPSYFRVTVTEGAALNGIYNGWCADLDYDITNGLTYPALVYSSLEPLPAGMIEHAENIDLINWILNQEFVGKVSPGGYGTYTQGDVQTAIWALIEETLVPGLGNANRINEILTAAQNNGEGYIPGCGNTFAVFLRPVNPATNRTVAQLVLVEAEITCPQPEPICNIGTATAEFQGTVVDDSDTYCIDVGIERP